MNYRLLYLTGEPQVTGQGGKGYCIMGPNQVNPLNFNKLSDTKSSNKARRKREMVILPREVRASDGTIQNVVTMSCGSGARCFNFNCVILDLAANQTAVIRIASRLWNATLVEDYAYGVNYVVIKSNAEIRLDPTLNIRQERHNDYFSVETKAIPDVTLLPPREVSWWWLIVAVLLGLILLALLILFLWKVGFFKRKKPGYTPAPTDDKDNLNTY
jgi:integrin alpha 7